MGVLRDGFSNTRSVWYDLFSSRHNRKVGFWDRVLNFGMGIYAITVTFVADLMAFPFRYGSYWLGEVQGWVKRNTVGRLKDAWYNFRYRVK